MQSKYPSVCWTFVLLATLIPAMPAAAQPFSDWSAPMNLGAANSVAWMFDRKAQVTVDAARAAEDAVMEAALDAGAEDMVRDGDAFLITGPVHQLHQITERLKSKQVPIQSAEIAMIPKSSVKVDGKDAKRLLQLIEALEEMDDVAKVSANFDIDAEALAAATA